MDNILSSIIDKSMTTDSDLFTLAKRLKIPLMAVVNKDRLHEFKPKARTGWIINLEDSDDGGGTHWTALWLDDKCSVYMDSFGIDPPNDVLQFAKRWKKDIIVSRDEIQDIMDGGCGQYAILFLYIANKLASKPEKALKTYQSIFL
jgi:hypothetical protein